MRVSLLVRRHLMQLQNTRMRFVVVGLCAAALVAAGATTAAQGKKASLEAVLESIQHVLAKVESLEQKADVITIQTSVWEQACIGLSAQCTGHTNDPASSANSNPVVIHFLVLRNGQPVTGLTSSDVIVEDVFKPANGPGVVRCDDPAFPCSPFTDSHFQNAANGLYALWVHPGGSNWKPGSYVMKIRVLDADAKEGHGVVEIEIAQ
jgi:hypothetical protein